MLLTLSIRSAYTNVLVVVLFDILTLWGFSTVLGRLYNHYLNHAVTAGKEIKYGSPLKSPLINAPVLYPVSKATNGTNKARYLRPWENVMYLVTVHIVAILAIVVALGINGETQVRVTTQDVSHIYISNMSDAHQKRDYLLTGDPFCLMIAKDKTMTTSCSRSTETEESINITYGAVGMVISNYPYDNEFNMSCNRGDASFSNNVCSTLKEDANDYVGTAVITKGSGRIRQERHDVRVLPEEPGRFSFKGNDAQSQAYCDSSRCNSRKGELTTHNCLWLERDRKIRKLYLYYYKEPDGIITGDLSKSSLTLGDGQFGEEILYNAARDLSCGDDVSLRNIAELMFNKGAQIVTAGNGKLHLQDGAREVTVVELYSVIMVAITILLTCIGLVIIPRGAKVSEKLMDPMSMASMADYSANAKTEGCNEIVDEVRVGVTNNHCLKRSHIGICGEAEVEPGMYILHGKVCVDVTA